MIIPNYRLLDTGLLSAAENIALDEVLTRRIGKKLSPPIFRFLQFFPDAVLVGYHQEIVRELRLNYCICNKIEINRRLTGGGAILFQSSALGWEIIAPLGVAPFYDNLESGFTRISRAVASALCCLGINACFRPRNDIEVDGRKISGTGGMMIDGGILFQGTILIKNEIMRFLKCLRVPVEKFKKREIHSIIQRLVFLEDLIDKKINIRALKVLLAKVLSEKLGFTLTPDKLSYSENRELVRKLPYYRSKFWLKFDFSTDYYKISYLFDSLQTNSGFLRVYLWLDYRWIRIQRVLFTGDFFSYPQRLVLDLETMLIGEKAEPGHLRYKILSYLSKYNGALIGITPDQIAQVVVRAAVRKKLINYFIPSEISELFLIGIGPEDIKVKLFASWLLIPYCSKPITCIYRYKIGCGLCNCCNLYKLYNLAEKLNIKIVTIKSFKHLINMLYSIRIKQEIFVGSCCEGFFNKHQLEMENIGARGILVNLDSTTCYDLGKDKEAYLGKFNHKTELNLLLLTKVISLMSPVYFLNEDKALK